MLHNIYTLTGNRIRLLCLWYKLVSNETRGICCSCCPCYPCCLETWVEDTDHKSRLVLTAKEGQAGKNENIRDEFEKRIQQDGILCLVNLFRIFKDFSKNLWFLTNLRSVSQTVKNIALTKEKPFFWQKFSLYMGFIFIWMPFCNKTRYQFLMRVLISKFSNSLSKAK